MRRRHGGARGGWAAAAGVAMLLAGCGPELGEHRDAFNATGELVALSGGEGGARHACFTCHGLDGGGDGASAPRLAGMDSGYLLKQLSDYASGLRRDEVMRPIALRLSDADRRAVAEYYAAMPAPPPPTAGPAPAAGRRLYHQGDPARQLVPCADCHGPAGQGGGAANPALAAQPQAYAAEQLRRFAAGERRNDPRGVMHEVAARLRAEERAAIAAYLAAEPAVSAGSSSDSGGSIPGAIPASTSSRSQR